MLKIQFILNIFLISMTFSLVKCQTSEPRIVNGYNVTSMNGFKHQVSIRSISAERSGFGAGHLCGGSLISNRLVLTAAHCVYNEKTKGYYAASNYVIAMGGLDRYVRDNNTLYINAAKIVGHAKFNYKNFANDIALIFLSQNVSSLHPMVQPIDIASSAPVVGTSCTISGWGTLSYNGPQPRQLQAASVTVNSKSDCNRKDRHQGGVLSGQFCAGPFNSTKIQDSCQGDSGGPLTCNGVLVGVTSNGVECALPNYPGIYTEVYSYQKWIETNDSSSVICNSFVILSAVFLSIIRLKLY